MRVVLITIFAVALASCQKSNDRQGDGEPISTIQVSGRQNITGGAPLGAGNISYRLSVEGNNLFRSQGGACAEMPEHGGGIYLGSATPQADGRFSLSVPTSSIRAAVVPSCLLSRLTTKQLQGLRLTASIPADPEKCAIFCAGTRPDDPGCADDCASGNRLLQAVHPIPPSEFSRILSDVRDGVLTWTQDLTFTRLGSALSDGEGVDLIVNAASTALSARVSREVYTPDSCETHSHCIRGTGLRTLLRFDTVVENVGAGDLELGNPANNPLFEMHGCHDHYHLKDVLLYELVHPSNGQVVTLGGHTVVGEKTSFCMMDMDPVLAAAPAKGFDCDNQGISSGWGDTYDSTLECQFIDVTGVPPGAYILRSTVNPDGVLDESITSNNVTEVPVTIK